jgi:hypothetical protein
MVVRFVGILIVLLLSKVLVQAQERCGTVPYMEHLFEKKNIKQDKEQFEQWLQAKTAQRKNGCRLSGSKPPLQNTGGCARCS